VGYLTVNLSSQHHLPYCTPGSHLEIVEVTPAVSFDLKHGEEERDLVARWSDNSHLAVGAVWIVTWPARTHDTSARCRQ